MKKTLGIMISMLMVSGLAGCGSSDTGSSDSGSADGSPSGYISVVSREDGSGTRDAFTEITGVHDGDVDNTTLDAIVHDSTGKVMTSIENDPNGLGYISLGSMNSTVKSLSVDGVDANDANVASGEYKLARPFNIAVSNSSELSDLATDFINFIFSTEGQDIIQANGCTRVEAGEAFESNGSDGILSIGGSTSVYPIMEKLKEAYLEINTNCDNINIEGSGSSSGMNGAIDGTFDIGMASRELKDSELAELEGMAIAKDGIAMVVNSSNGLGNMTMDEIKEVYVGNITDFSELAN